MLSNQNAQGGYGFPEVNVGELIERCTHGDAEACERLRSLIARFAACPIRRVVNQWGIDRSERYDLLQDLFLYLFSNGLDKLRHFHGASIQEFAAFVRAATCRFGTRRVSQLVRQHQQDAELSGAMPPPDRGGPTEEQIAVARQELEALVPEADRRKLYLIWLAVDGGQDAVPVSERTLRRWRQAFYDEYHDRV